MTETETLLHCPFCGGKADLSFEHSTSHPDWWKVTCVECGCRTVTNTTSKAKAIERWNTRGLAPTPDLQVGWRWKWGEADFWKMTDDPALVPESAPIKEPLYAQGPDTSTDRANRFCKNAACHWPDCIVEGGVCGSPEFSPVCTKDTSHD